MSLAELKDQAAHLQLSELRELIAFLVARQTALDEDFQQGSGRKRDLHDAALLSEASLAEDWNRPEEDAAWAHLQQGQ